MIPSSLPLSSFPVFASAWLLSYAIHSTILLGTVWVVARWARAAPGLLDSLWKMALVGGIFTAAWQVAGPGHETLGGSFGLENPTPASAPVQEFVFYSPDPGGTTLPQASPVWTPAVEAIGTYWPVALLAIWMLGASLGMGQLLIQRLRLSRVLSHRIHVEGHPARLILDRLCRKSGITHPVRLSTSHRLHGPVALDSHEIILPERALETLSPAQLENVLAHELAHVARRDPTWRWLSAIVQRLFFFQPLNRNARRGLRDVAEFMCDDWAVRHTGQNVTLARCLVEVAGWMKTQTRPVAAAGMAEHGSPLVRRVERLLSGKGRADLSRNWKLAAVSVLLIGVVMTAPSVIVNQSSESPSAGELLSPRSANSWVSAASSTHTPFYQEGESWPMSSGRSRDVESTRFQKQEPPTRIRRAREPRRYRITERVAPPVSRVVLRTPEPISEPSLIVIPETTERHAVIFSVETPVEPVRVRLDRLVVELERLSIEIEHANLGVHAQTLELLARKQKELWPRLLELQQKLHESGTLRLEVLAPVDCEATRIQDVIRMKTTQRQLHLEEEKLHRDHQRIHRRARAPVVRI